MTVDRHSPVESPLEYLDSRILTFYREAREILEGKIPVPRMAIVYPTYVCNQSCLWCEYSHENGNVHTVMTRAQLRHTLESVVDLGVESVEFCGGGEPSMHPGLADSINWLGENGVRVGLITNGSGLRANLRAALIRWGSYVRVGMDSGDALTFEKVKRPATRRASFEVVCANIRALIAERDAAASKLSVSTKIVVDRNNLTEMDTCVRLARDLGVNSIQFKAARLTPSEITPEEASSGNLELDRLRSAHPELHVIGSLGKLTTTTRCWVTPFQVTIDTVGDVYLCCYYTQRKEAHRFGNVFETPLGDIWYSAEHLRKIEAIEPAECSKMDCRMIRYNKTLDHLIREDEGQFQFL